MSLKLESKPCKYTGISQPYKSGKHKGIDLVNHRLYSKTPIRATAAGVVVAASRGAWDKSYGNMVAIYHGGGNYTNYAHLSKICVKVGDRVKPTDLLGYMGTTGNSTGIHLHYEVHKGRKWNRVNPKPYMDEAEMPVEYEVITKASNLLVRSGPSGDAERIGSVKKGTIIVGTKAKGNWVYFPSLGGWCNKTFLKKKG